MIEPGVHERVRRVVIDLLGVHRADDADVVGDAGDVRERSEISCPDCAMLLELAERPARLQHRVLQLGELLALGERLGERLAVELASVRLEVEGLEVRRPARHAEVDDALRLDRAVRRVEHASPAFARAVVSAAPRAVPEKSDGSSSPARAMPPRP